MSGVYQIYNPINNKRYIGSSIYDTLLNSKMVDAIKLKQPLLK